MTYAKALKDILNAYACVRPDRDDELGWMGVLDELEDIAESLDNGALEVAVF